MKIIVFSDSHGDSFKMLEALTREKDCLGYILHLGDHCTDIRYIERAAGIIPAVAVVGNNDHYMAQLEYAEEKKKALSLLMKAQTGKDFEFEDKMVAFVSIIKITVSEELRTQIIAAQTRQKMTNV